MASVGRREFITTAAGLAGGLALNLFRYEGVEAAGEGEGDGSSPFFRTRGVVLSPDDLTLSDWPERAARAGLTTIGLHHLDKILKFIPNDSGQEFLERCSGLGLEIEYELHAMSRLLPRELFKKDRSMFRMNADGDRVPDFNLCIHSPDAVETVCENALALAEIMKPTSGRHFFWIDDAKPMCFCGKCRGLSSSDQALLLENQVVKALRRREPEASLAHLAYHGTLDPPKQISPEEGVFLEFAPIGPGGKFIPKIDRSWDREREALEGNLKVFPVETVQVLEYWLDSSMWSRWRGRDKAIKLPWDRDVFAEDIDFYGSRGIRNVTTFAVYLDSAYVQKYGEFPLKEYGEDLYDWRP